MQLLVFSSILMNSPSYLSSYLNVFIEVKEKWFGKDIRRYFFYYSTAVSIFYWEHPLMCRTDVWTAATGAGLETDAVWMYSGTKGDVTYGFPLETWDYSGREEKMYISLSVQHSQQHMGDNFKVLRSSISQNYFPLVVRPGKSFFFFLNVLQ